MAKRNFYKLWQESKENEERLKHKFRSERERCLITLINLVLTVINIGIILINL